MNNLKSVLSLGALAAIGFAAPLQAQTSLSLYGDMDCFGTGGPCVEDGSTWLPGGWGSVTSSGDPTWTDQAFNTSSVVSWTQTFAATATDAWLRIRTAGIADIAGPYSVFVDGTAVGAMPIDGPGHILVETFTFLLPGTLLADGSATISFTPDASDTWAIDYAEIYTASVPEPGTLFLLSTGLLGLAFRKRREEGSVL